MKTTFTSSGKMQNTNDIDVEKIIDDGIYMVLHAGRNAIYRVRYYDYDLVKKEFGSRFKNEIVYALRSSKAKRSYYNACELLRRDISTPAPRAYIETRGRFNTLKESAYICDDMPSIPLCEVIETYGDVCLTAFAAFVAELHEKGILHHDLNNTNVRVNIDDDNNFLFSLIDLNRMTIFETERQIPPRLCFKNLTRFSGFDDGFIYFAKEYLKYRNLDERYLNKLIKIKKSHDKSVNYKLALKRFIKRIIH